MNVIAYIHKFFFKYGREFSTENINKLHHYWICNYPQVVNPPLKIDHIKVKDINWDFSISKINN